MVARAADDAARTTADAARRLRDVDGHQADCDRVGQADDGLRQFFVECMVAARPLSSQVRRP